ncbi:MAG TPA: DUF106 domain-containing protein [Thermoplasmata archaeon]|nr:DUF106 domain-containing protein [Thermoplasmata archaeon]
MQEGKPKGPMSAMLPLMVVMILVLVLFQFINIIGPAINLILGPIIGFDGRYPLLTCLIAALLMAGLGGIIRFFSTDLKQSAQSKRVMQAFQKEMREAKMTHDMSKIKKLNKAMPEIQGMQQESMASSGGGTKTMVLSMAITIPIFMWLLWYIGMYGMETFSYVYFDVPWASHVALDAQFGAGPCAFPAWLIVFLPLSIALGGSITKIFSLIGLSDWWTSKHKK